MPAKRQPDGSLIRDDGTLVTKETYNWDEDYDPNEEQWDPEDIAALGEQPDDVDLWEDP